MTTHQAIWLMRLTQRKLNELIDEAVAELSPEDAEDRAGSTAASADESAGTDPVSASAQSGEPWSLEGPLPEGGWESVDSTVGETYKWPDGNIDSYTEFVRFRGTGASAGTMLALGFKDDGDVVGFVLGSGGGSKRGLTYFFPADNFVKTNEKVSMIRGGGPRGRSGFGPSAALPQAYATFKVEMLADRKLSKWNVQAVVAGADDHVTMLNHTALQAKLRGLL